MTTKLISFAGVLLLLAGIAQADESAVDQVKGSAHAAATDVDKTAHKAKRSVKHHGRKAKTDVQNSTDDNGARKAGRRMKDTGNDALDKVDDTVHGH